jgi:H+/Cl- antiporter ClcA
MAQSLRHIYPRHRGISWAPVLFLVAFLLALALVAVLVIAPMLQAASHALPQERKQVSAFAALLLCLLLATLLLGLVMTMRAGRIGRSGIGLKHKPTEYPDVWEESARRVEIPDPEDLEDDPPSDKDTSR